MTPDAPALAIENLSVSYGLVPAVNDVSLTVRRGSIVTLIGANGAGKSTIIKAVCGLLKVKSGAIRLFGEDIVGRSPDLIVRKGLSVVPEGRRLFVDMTLKENLEMGAYTRGEGADLDADYERVFELFPELKNRQGTVVGRFSGGQQQMVAVARALMNGPRLLLLDEPTIGLAPAVVDRIANTIVEISRRGVDILLVEQNAEIALSLAHYGYILENGSIVTEDSAEALASSEDVQRAYLGI